MAADTMSGAVVVTGAAGALGKAVVARLAREDLPVVALDVADAARLPAEAAHAIGGVDAGDETAANDAFREIGQRFGSIRGLVNVVGGFAWETIADGSVATRSEEHTSELQSLMRISYAVFCLKKKKS